MSEEETGEDWAYGKIQDPINRWGQLPPKTRKFFENLRPEDIDDMSASLNLYRKLKAAAWFNKWLLIIAFTSFMSAVAFGESLQKVLQWFASGKP